MENNIDTNPNSINDSSSNKLELNGEFALLYPWFSLVEKSITMLNDKSDRMQTDINGLQINSFSKIFSFKDDIRKQLSLITNTITKAQLKIIVISMIFGFIGSAIANIIFKAIELIIAKFVGR